MNKKFIRTISVLLFLTTCFIWGTAIAEGIQEGKMYISVKKDYSTWDNPLHSEFLINNKTVDIFSADKFVAIDEYLQPGWNDITIKTAPQEPAARENNLIFKIGPMYKDPKDSGKIIMSPVLWKFDNGTDWDLQKDGTYLHPLGPDVKEVTLNYHVYWAGLEHEGGQLKAGDYVLYLKPEYSWNSPILTTVSVNGTPFSSFLGSKRQIILSSLLKPGKNEVRVISHKVDNTFKDNDLEGEIAGPAEWSPGEKKYMLPPVTSFNGMVGWNRDKQTGKLSNPASPEASYIERTISIMVKSVKKKPAEKKPAPENPEFKKTKI